MANISSTQSKKWPRKLLKILFLSVVAFLSFITSLLANFLQLVNYLLFHHTYPNIGRYINRHLQDIILSRKCCLNSINNFDFDCMKFCFGLEVTTILEWHCGVRFRVFYANKETKDLFGTEHSLVIGNHCFQIDAMFYWLSCQVTRTLGNAKAYAKSDLRWMPILGWVFYFGEFIFLKRNWKEDQKNIGPSLSRLMEHPYPIVLLILPEGTRFTPEKYLAGKAFAKEHNIPFNIKHHLLPRVKGFTNSLRYLQSKCKLKQNKIK